MDYIIGDRRSGKTTKAVQLVKDNKDLLLMVFASTRKIELQEQYPEIKDRIVCMSDFLLGRKEQGVVLDEADLILNHMFHKEKGRLLKVIVLYKKECNNA